jgi:hypothetical protein
MILISQVEALMNRKILKFLILTILISGCSDNRFVRRDLVHIATIGISGFFDHNDYQFCKKNNPDFIKPYKNGVEPIRTCRNQQYYVCHVSYYCKGDKQCEKDAKQYWIGEWSSGDGGVTDAVVAAGEYCGRIKKQCDAAKTGDQTCRR